MNLLILLCFVSLPAVAWCRTPFVRVVGGQDTTIDVNRHQLSLRFSGTHSCGASLISSTRAVTTAHCLGQATILYSVLAGSTDRTDTGCSTCALRNLLGYTRHPNYVDNVFQGYPNDIAVVTFSAIGSNAAIGYVAMATAADGDFTDESCSLTGWGLTSSSSGGTQPATLQLTSMNVLANAVCNDAWPTTPISSGQLCTSSPTSSACAGDDGGPLICRNKLAGVMSWMSSNCSPLQPSVFTRVSEYKSWIDGQF